MSSSQKETKYNQPVQQPSNTPGEMEVEQYNNYRKMMNNRMPQTQNNNIIRLAYQADVATTYQADEEPDSIKKVSIDKLSEQRKKLGNAF